MKVVLKEQQQQKILQEQIRFSLSCDNQKDLRSEGRCVSWSHLQTGSEMDETNSGSNALWEQSVC